MSFREELKFRFFAIFVMLIVIFVVLQIHKWSIEEIHKRLQAVESQLSIKTDEI